MSLPDVCMICGASPLSRRLDYDVCPDCGHEVLAASDAQTFMLNEPLDTTSADRVSALDRFKNRTVRRWMKGRAQLIDFGSATGRFLHQNRAVFGAVTGVEITPEAVVFCRGIMGLEIHTRTADLPPVADMITAWHSIEHVPGDAMDAVMTDLASRLRPGGRLIVSVPNTESWQYRILGRGYAFYDPPNHHHQFTLESLDRLLQRVGLTRIDDARSVEYTGFGWIQGLLNALGFERNFLYYRLKRREGPRRPEYFLLQIALLPVVALPAFALTAAELTGGATRQAVLTICYERAPAGRDAAVRPH